MRGGEGGPLRGWTDFIMVHLRPWKDLRWSTYGGEMLPATFLAFLFVFLAKIVASI